MALTITTALDLLDITKSPLELIIDKLNLTYSRQFKASDFVLSDPEPANEDAPEQTRVFLRPTISSVYYNSFAVVYNRVRVSDLMFFDSQLKSNGKSTLYQLLPFINAAYGVNITENDVHDALIEYTLNGNTDSLGTVAIRAKANSHLFVGEVYVRMNVKSSDGVSVNEDDRTYFTFSALYEPSGLIPGMREVRAFCQNTLGEKADEFVLAGENNKLYTAATGSFIAFKKDNNNFVLLSQQFTVVTNSDLATRRDYKMIEIDPKGDIVSTGQPNTSLYLPADAGNGCYRVETDFHNDRVYCFFRGVGQQPKVINTAGGFLGDLSAMLQTPDVDLVPPSVLPTAVAVHSDGSLYVVDSQGKKIYRYDTDLVADTNFAPVTLVAAAVNNLAVIDNQLYAAYDLLGEPKDAKVNGALLWPVSVLNRKTNALLRFDLVTGRPDLEFNQQSGQYWPGLVTTSQTQNSLLSFGDIIVVPQDNNLLGFSFFFFDKDGSMVTSGWQSMISERDVLSSSIVLPISAHEMLVSVMLHVPTPAGFVNMLRLYSRNGIKSADFLELGEDLYPTHLFMVNPNEQQ